MDCLEAIKARRSVRRYQPDKKIDKDKIEKILDAGRWAPSARDTQPWQFVVVEDKTRLKEFADITDYGKFIKDASACIAVYCEDGKYFLEDGSAAVENILLAATAENLGTCWVAGDKKAYCGTISKLLGVSGGLKLIALISIGYAADRPGNRKRKPLDKIVHWERY